MTEIGSVTYSESGTTGFDPSSVGVPMRNVRLQLINSQKGVSELLVTAPSMLTRYFDEHVNLRGGFFSTGDLARLESKRLYITGRTRLLIETAGRKVNPLEIEEVLAAHPAVAACLVVAVRQTETVQRLRAIIEPRDASCPPTDQELRLHARQYLSPHKVPRSFEFRETLARSTTGKVLRSAAENL
jgi:acyl-CoA synthetase (AMP-forming)/AMP-acid ligase II